MVEQSPEHVLGEGDPGADVFRRYRYQATYAAIIALGMLKSHPDILEVFAEHHDDILLKLQSGRFNAVQVKTQGPGGTPFKASDDEIKTALGKFISHERVFGDAFEHYTIVTNHQFFREDNKASLYFLIEKAKEAKGPEPADMDNRLSGFINSLLRTHNRDRDETDRATRTHILTVIRKLCLDDSLPKLEGIHHSLREAIVNIEGRYRTATYADLERAAQALAYAAYLKSSLPSDGASHLYLSYAIDPRTAERDAIIDQKRIMKEQVAELLAKEIAARATLTAADPIDPKILPKDLSRAEKKMTAGGISATTVAASRDWRASAEYLQRQWAMKYEDGPAIERYNHIAVAVQTACAEAHEATRSESPQGPPMLDMLKTVLRRKRIEGTNFFDCEEEHLLGHAIIRSGQCKVWWSPEFDVE